MQRVLFCVFLLLINTLGCSLEQPVPRIENIHILKVDNKPELLFELDITAFWEVAFSSRRTGETNFSTIATGEGVGRISAGILALNREENYTLRILAFTRENQQDEESAMKIYFLDAW